ncbi:MAG TPA: N-acetyltransferase [Tepidisphaeraceae bacterium]|nr:N-acetyltransferase [Tepidisphaeraceae bacterium]
MLSSRPVQLETDLPAMLDLARECWALAGPNDYHPGQLCWEVPRLGRGGKARLWFAGNQLIALCLFYARMGYGTLIHPQWRTPEISRQVISWAEEEYRASANDPERPSRLLTTAYETETLRRSMLQTNGFVLDGFSEIHFRQALDYPLSPAPLPAGFSVRNITGEREAEPRVMVHREAFAPSRLTVMTYLDVMETPGYRTELDLVAVAPDGVFTAFCLCWFDPRSRLGLIEPAGAHPDYRRRGLARAVLTEGLRRLQALGATAAIVNARDDNDPGKRLYTSLGFHPANRSLGYAKGV